MDELAKLDQTVAALEPLCDENGAFPDTAIILGSGLGAFVDELTDPQSLSYAELPGFPVSTVKGHAGRLVVGSLGSLRVAVLQGRFHLYEGYSAAEVARPVRALIRAGVSRLIVTNAAGGLGDSMTPGDLMLITDHLNLSGRNPLVGPHDERTGDRFPDMTEAYDRALAEDLRGVAREQGLKLCEGVYAVLGGPSYETPAEVRALRVLGASAVGMSTVYEVIAARQMGCRILGLSLISNLAAGMSGEPLSHEEVVEVGREASGRFIKLLRGFLKRLASEADGTA